MVECGDKHWRNIVGGLADFNEVFLTTVKAVPLVPVVAGETTKAVLAVHCEERNELISIFREQLGYFIDDDTTVTSYNEAELWRLCRIARRMHDRKTLVLCKSETDVSPLNDQHPIDAARDHLQLLTECFNNDSLHAKIEERLGTLGKILAHVTYMPSNCFLKLAQQLTWSYLHYYPDVFCTVVALVKGLTMNHALPKVYVKHVFLPLFVPHLFEKKTTMTVHDEEHEVSRYGFTIKPFCGFGYKGDPTGCVPWDGYSKLTKMQEITIDVSCQSGPLAVNALQASLKESIHNVSMSNKTNNPKWIETDNRLTDWASATNIPPFISQSVGMRAVKSFFGTALGIATLQSQLALITPGWTTDNVIDAGTMPNETDVLKYLKKLTMLRLSKMNSILSGTAHNAFNMTDVTVQTCGSEKADSKMHKLMYVTPSQGQQSEAAKAMGEIGVNCGSLRCKSDMTDKVMQYGVWSPYNSTECSLWGNLNSRDPNSAQQVKFLREPLTTINSATYKRWIYEIKTIPINEPVNIVAWFYNARLTILSTVGAVAAAGNEALANFSDNNRVSPSDFAAMLDTITECVRQETTRGYLARVKDVAGTMGMTFNLMAAVATTKGYAMSKSNTDNCTAKTGEFRRLDWMDSSPDDSDRMKYLHKTFDLKKLLTEAGREFNFYYKRPYYVSPRGAGIKSGHVMRHKSSYVYAPVCMLVSHMMVNGMGRWCTSTLDTVDRWSNINVYRIIIDSNQGIYSKGKREQWCKRIPGSTHLSLQWSDIMNELIDGAGIDGKVLASQINAYSINRSTYTLIKDQLTTLGKYVEDEAPNFTADIEDDVDNSIEGIDTVDASVHQPFSGKRTMSQSLCDVIEASTKKRKTMCE